MENSKRLQIVGTKNESKSTKDYPNASKIQDNLSEIQKRIEHSEGWPARNFVFM